MAQADSNHTTKLCSSIRDPLTKSTHESITGDRGGMSSVTRRMIMNSIVALPIVAALPVAAPAMPSTAADQSMLDADLVQAALDMEAADKAIEDLHNKFGDDTDSRADYSALQRQRNDHIATLITVPALSAAGVQAKAGVLRLNRLIEDYEQHQQVAVSLADDIAERSLPMPGICRDRRIREGLCRMSRGVRGVHAALQARH
jgi:hypothetical protein